MRSRPPQKDRAHNFRIVGTIRNEREERNLDWRPLESKLLAAAAYDQPRRRLYLRTSGRRRRRFGTPRCGRPRSLFRIYDLRSPYETRLSAGRVADEWVTQLLRQGDAKVFKKYSQTKLQVKREALQKLNRQGNESSRSFETERPN